MKYAPWKNFINTRLQPGGRRATGEKPFKRFFIALVECPPR